MTPVRSFKVIHTVFNVLLFPLDYLFYQLHEFHRQVQKVDHPAFVTVCSMAFLMSTNLGSILSRTDGYLNLERWVDYDREPIALVAASLVFNFALFFAGKRYKNVISRFENETETLKGIGTMAVSAFVFLTVLFYLADFSPAARK